MISFFVSPIWIFCHLCQHEAIKIFQGPRPISQWWQKYGAQREKDGTRCHFLQIDFLIHPITWRQYGLDYNSEWHSMTCTRGDWTNSFDVFSKQSWEEDAKKYGRVFFSSVLSKAFCESFWGQSLVTISKKTYSSLFLGYGKGKGQVWGLEPTEFPIYQPITFFFLL